MGIGLLWLPSNLRDYRTMAVTNYDILDFEIDERDNRRFNLQITNAANDLSLVRKWIINCQTFNVYMLLPNHQNHLRHWEFQSARPSMLAAKGDVTSTGWFTVICDVNRRRELAFVPPFLHHQQNIAALGIEVGGARRAIYR